MAIEYIYRLCQSCGGDGKQDTATEAEGEHEVECTQCEGTGKLLWGELHDELIGQE